MSNLSRVAVRENPLYRKSGIKSYAWVLAKYSITPTKNGPFFRGTVTSDLQKTAVQDNPHRRLHHGKHPVGPLLKRGALVAADSGAHKVTTEDVQTDSLYLSSVQIGNPPQEFWLDFDSGSSDLWVFDTKLKSKFPQGGSGHHFFDPSRSQAVPGAKFEIHFGDGSWAKGKVVKDDLRVGGITVEGQAIEIAEAIDQSFVSGAGDGLLGLAFGNINSVTPQQVKTPVENMIAQQDISSDQELFTCKLGSWKDREDEPDKGESFFTFGFIDQDTVNATGDDIFYTQVFPNNGFWQFASTSATVNGSKISRPNNTAIADTGTTLALIDDSTAEAIYGAIPGSKFDETNGGWVYPAETTEAQLPVVTLAVGAKQFVVQKEDLAFSGFEDSNGKSWVFGGIQSRGDSELDILGDTFLKGIYAIFDSGKTRFGAVQRKELRQNLEVPTE